MNHVQGDCRFGVLGFVAGADLSASAGLLAKINASGQAVLASSVSDMTPYVIVDGAELGEQCGLAPLNSFSNSRVLLKGACQAGQLLVSAGDGRVEAGTAESAATGIGLAEEAGVNGQLVLLRPVSGGARGASLVTEAATGRLAVGSTAAVSGDKGTAVGLTAAATGSSTVVGFGAKMVTGVQGVVAGASATGFGNNSLAVGAYSYAAGAESAAFGYVASSAGIKALAFGNNASAAGNGAVSVGYGTTSTAAGRLELAAGNALYGYSRVSGQATGSMQFSLPSAATAAPTSSGSAAFNNADGTLPVGMWTAQLNAGSTALIVYVNAGGTIKTASLSLT